MPRRNKNRHRSTRPKGMKRPRKYHNNGNSPEVKRYVRERRWREAA
jgi:hypothetical protein